MEVGGDFVELVISMQQMNLLYFIDHNKILNLK